MDHNRSRIPYSYVIHYTFNYTWLVIIIFAYYLVHGENNYLQGQKAVLHGYSYVQLYMTNGNAFSLIPSEI